MGNNNAAQSLKRHLEDYLSEFVYGGIDGAVTTFAVVAGATGAKFGTTVIIVLGFANLIADGFSMGVGSYLSTKSDMEMAQKRGKVTDDSPSPIINGATTYVSFIIVGLVPLLSYAYSALFNTPQSGLFLSSCILTGAAFVGVGLLKNKVTKGSVFRSVLETVILGAIAAGVAYFVGGLLRDLVGVSTHTH